MAQAKKKTATKTTKKTAARKSGTRANTRTAKKQETRSNMFFVISMSMLAATLLFANLLMMSA
ncbi:hypothetical protein IJG28_03130 [Candidatus Saccharibacteria bacterium]|nr:hypothetical protein [Candidatus Saccharibacteria bacterium]